MLVLLEAALASPRFVGAPEDTVVAEAAWEAAIACTGRDAAAAEEVPIHRDLPPDGPDGIADTGDGGLLAVHLQPGSDHAVLAHEVAHAWIHSGEAWMAEGRTELLALCIGERIPEHVRFRHYGGQPALPADLRTWTDAAASFETHDFEDIHAFYVHSQRLFEAIELVIPEQRFFADLDSPEALDFELRTRVQGRHVLAALEDVRSQREALSDPDRDGLTTLYERIAGTDPYRWDSDGDGWWDGAGEHPEHAVVVPRDGSVICSPWAPPGAERMDLVGGGNLHGHDVLGERWPNSSLKRGVRMSARHAQLPGGMWVAVDAEALVDNPLCRVREPYTLRDMTGQLVEPLAVLDEHLQGFFEDLAEQFGPAPRRTSVELHAIEGRLKRVGDSRGPIAVQVPAAIVLSAAELGQLDFLAAHVAAAHRFGFEPELSQMAAPAAFAWLATRTPVVGEPYVAAERDAIRELVRRARQCETSWRGLAESDC